MRINSLSVRLNYTASWEGRTRPGREAGRASLISSRLLANRLEALFDHSRLREWLLLSRLRIRLDGQGCWRLTAYVYLHPLVEARARLSRQIPPRGSRPDSKRPVDPRRLRLFLLSNYARRFLAKANLLAKTSLPTLVKGRLRFVLVVHRFFEASLAFQYIIRKLLLRFKLSRVLPLLARDLIQDRQERGLLVQCSGRFDRKERASHLTFGRGRVFIGTLHQRIAYYQGTVTLRYGICGVKVWLLKRRTGTHDPQTYPSFHRR